MDTYSFISACSYYEHFLYFFAKKVENESIIKLSDFSGRGCYQYRNYISKVGMVIPNIENDLEWKEIFEYLKIRNCIVHNQNIMQKPNKVAERHDIYFGPDIHGKNQNRMIRIRDKAFLVDFISLVSNHMKMLVHSIQG